ncbi:MAG: glycosyltransferase [Candidatus Bathyarchaeia archaeon]
MSANQNTKVSIIIPTYQEGKYIQTLLTKLMKINNLLEVIVVDGGSTDETVVTAKNFTDKVYEINQRGIAKARNYGAYKSSGEILVFLDADVSPPLDFVERILKMFRDKMIVGLTCKIMPKQPRTSELMFFIFYNDLLRFCSLFKPHSRGEFLAVKRECFMKLGGFDEKLPCLEDHELTFRISKLGKFVFVPDLVVYESMRRFRKSGLLKVLKEWVSNYISLILFQKTISKIWKPVR